MKKVNFGWNIGFWVGVASISIINIGLILLNRNQLLYDFYILGISIIILIILIMISKKQQHN
ncbi:Uncharacterised protein [uncultured archaeon]|nr:Uncharacterised protein [uncultured archaeon]